MSGNIEGKSGAVEQHFPEGYISGSQSTGRTSSVTDQPSRPVSAVINREPV
ncbi:MULTISPECIES: hypothetical protein [Streptomyces]|uniref:hypothetical protein n=1 Tax=Streptomyces TaxID=1883 RepID=UPI000AC1FC1D|nr:MULTISPECIES: hypothetical protein [Streptomyces]